MYSVKTQKEVDRQNDILRRDLGHPVYAWRWSDSLFITMADMTQDEAGNKIIKKAIKQDLKSGLFTMTNTYTRKLMVPSLPHRWVLCRQVFPDVDDGRWGETFGADPDQMRNGIWLPCTNNRGVTTALEPWKTPAIDDTNYIIGCIRAERDMPRNYEEQFAENQRKQEQENIATMTDKFIDKAPAFGGIPGKKTHWAGGYSKSIEEGMQHDSNT